MKDFKIYVFINLNGVDELVGELWAHFRSGSESASFRYAESWLNNKYRFAIDTALPLSQGSFHTAEKHKLFGVFSDAAPDRWGRILMRRHEAIIAKKQRRPLQTLNEIDYLLRVSDKIRQGALRFKTALSANFVQIDSADNIPPLVALPKLLAAAQNVADDTAAESDIKILLTPGSSLGGARPKAAVQDMEGRLFIAKFPQRDDENNNVLWEAVALHLATNAGIRTPYFRVEKIKTKPILLSQRFDRDGVIRLPFLSAMSVLGASDNDGLSHSYLEIADAIKMFGASPNEDLHELWRRVVFSILISNTDDHLRNHGFLYSGEKGWRLSPIYDLQPNPEQAGMLHTNISENSNLADVELALSVADYFNIPLKKAKMVYNEVSTAVFDWKKIAKQFGIKAAEIERMEPAFKNLKTGLKNV